MAVSGDGFSARLEDSILHGCIPVIIQDQVHVAFESLLKFPAFSVRVAQADMPRIPQILMGIRPQRLAKLQSNLKKVWHRFAYLSQPLIRQRAEAVKQEWQADRAAQTESSTKQRAAVATADGADAGSEATNKQRLLRQQAPEGSVAQAEPSWSESAAFAGSEAFSDRDVQDDAFGTIIQFLYYKMVSFYV